ncbi:MFS transporter [Micromonospora sp. NPDC023888]|uniref:MFS transporter n=1 Tax=Micromonospora sp. NPDC023888 TaxID=3155607 RepID=UPI0033E70A39
MSDGFSAGTFWRWWSAGTISALGSAVTALALPLTALIALDASAFDMGLVAAAGYVAWLVIGLPAGVIVQRVPLRGIQVTTDLTRAAAVLSVPLTWWTGHLTITQLVVVALVISFSTVLFDVANATYLPGIVDRDQLESRNSLTTATHAVSQVSGPPLGGIAVQLLGAAPTLLIDAASYGVSALLLRSLPARPRQKPDHWPPVRAMIREGWHFVSGHPVMAPGTWAATALCVACGAQIALYPLHLVRTLEAPAGLVGLLLAVEGVGSLIGAALTPRLTGRIGSARALLLSSVVCVVGAIVVPLGSGIIGYLCFAVGSAVFAAGVVLLSIITRTYRQLASPPDLLSRVLATVRFVTWGAIPIGGLAAGALASLHGSRVALLTSVIAVVCAPLVLFCSPVRHLHDLADHPGSDPERDRDEPVVVGR